MFHKNTVCSSMPALLFAKAWYCRSRTHALHGGLFCIAGFFFAERSNYMPRNRQQMRRQANTCTCQSTFPVVTMAEAREKRSPNRMCVVSCDAQRIPERLGHKVTFSVFVFVACAFGQLKVVESFEVYFSKKIFLVQLFICSCL